MPRIIFKCPHLKPDQQRSPSRRENYVRYIATREGVEFVPRSGTDGPATKKQKALAEKLLRDFPHCRELFEYEDYLASPTCGNASEFITRALEDNFDQISRRENYVDYIANRPRVERLSSHGLFTGGDSLPPLSQIAETVANHGIL